MPERPTKGTLGAPSGTEVLLHFTTPDEIAKYGGYDPAERNKIIEEERVALEQKLRASGQLPAGYGIAVKGIQCVTFLQTLENRERKVFEVYAKFSVEQLAKPPVAMPSLQVNLPSHTS